MVGLILFFRFCLWMAVDTCWQTTAMRTFSMRDPEISRKVFTWTGFIYLGRGMMPMVWGIAALTLLGPRQNSLEAMPTLLAKILPSIVLGLVVSGMLGRRPCRSTAPTSWVGVHHRAGYHPSFATKASEPPRPGPLNRVANLFVSLFVLFWGVWYTLPGPTYFYLNITATIFLGGAFAAVIAGIYWRRANTLGGYCAMLGGALGAVAFFFFHVSTSYAGLGSFAVAGLGMVVGSLWGKGASAVVPKAQ